MNAQILSIIVGVSSLLGLLSLLAYLFLNIRAHSAERSVRGIIEGEGLFNPDQIISILEKFQNDSARLDALKELTNVDIKKAERVLDKVKNNVDIGKLSSESQNTSIKYLRIGAIFFIVIAIIGGGFSIYDPDDNLELELVPDNGIDVGNDIINNDISAKSTVIPLHNSISSRLRFVTWLNDKFLVGLSSPNEILSLNEQGKIVGDPIVLTGEPRSVASNGSSIFVGQRFPGLIEQFDINTLESLKKFEIPDVEQLNQVWSGSPSTEPSSIAAGKDEVWINTEGNGVPIIYHLNIESGRWTVPEFDGLGHDNSGWVLSNAWNKFFAVTSETTPSSIYELTKSRIFKFGGHDYESLSCTPAIWDGTVGDISIISCDDELIDVNFSDKPKIVRSWGNVPKTYTGGWSHYEIISTGNNFLISRTNYNQNPWYPTSTTIMELTIEGSSNILFEKQDVELVDMAASEGILMLAIKDNQNKTQAYRIKK